MAEHQPANWEIFCIVIDGKNPFSVKIQPNATVDTLKKAIKKEKEPELDGFAADRLILYLINLPDDDDLAKKVKKPLTIKPLTALKATRQVGDLDLLRNGPIKETVYILVQTPDTLPSAGQKHGLSDDDVDGDRSQTKRRVRSNTEPVTDEMQQAASALHAKAWGKPWPQSEDTIYKTEIDNETGSVDDESYGIADKLVVPLQFPYRYLKGIRSLKSALGTRPGRHIKDFLVVREEYERLCLVLEDDSEGIEESVVVTGHPGIGKSTFLLYLFLYRLERELPTAVQFGANYYLIFDAQGAAVRPASVEDPRLEKCWALTDSNEKISQPCDAFINKAGRIILASSPQIRRWKEWIKQEEGRRIISDVPSVPEIAAITKELRKEQRKILEKELGKELGTELEKRLLYDPSSTLSLVRKWGPSTRNILRSMEFAARGRADPIEEEAQVAVNHICENPSTIFGTSATRSMPQSEGSSVIFLRRNGSAEWDQALTFIPTPYLLGMFEEERTKKSNRECLTLFYALSSHGLTRGTVGWAHEKSVHERLGTGGAHLNITQGLAMRPSTRILPGILAGLKDADANDSFYWIPSVANFPGIDSVLGNTDGHVYTIQATIASHHTSPLEGIKKVWAQFRPAVRTSRTWHFVIITDSQDAADAYTQKFSSDFSNFRLGNTHVQVQFWACVLRVVRREE